MATRLKSLLCLLVCLASQNALQALAQDGAAAGKPGQVKGGLDPVDREYRRLPPYSATTGQPEHSTA